jgi:probable HAF family extracellular repeat protein
MYNIVAVGPAGSVATAVAHDGSVSGYFTDEQGTRSAFVFNGATSILRSDAMAHDTSGAGVTAGTVFTDAGTRAAVWDAAGERLLDLVESAALAVNENGEIAGSAVRDGRTSAFVSSGSTTAWIEAGSWSAAYDISNRGQAVGTYQDASGRFRGFTWSAATGFSDLGSLGGGALWAQAINESGTVVGSSLTGGGYLHAFLRQSGLVDLGTLGGTASAAYDVNGLGHVVGYSFDRDGVSRAFLWRDGMMFDLNQLVDPAAGWTLEAAYGVTGDGQIAGTGFWNGERRGFLLQPLGATQQPSQSRATPDILLSGIPQSEVPEPGNIVATLIAAGLFIAIHKSGR